MRMAGASMGMLMGRHMHINPRAAQALFTDGNRFNLERFNRQTGQAAVQILAIDAKIQQSRQNHIAAGAANAVEMQVFHKCHVLISI